MIAANFLRSMGIIVKLPSESAEQITFVSWFRKTYPEVLIFAIPNGGLRHKAVGAKLKLEGVVSGIPDLFIPEWSLWIEMKREKGGTTSAQQKEIIEYLNSINQPAIICKGHKAAIEAVKKYGTTPPR